MNNGNVFGAPTLTFQKVKGVYVVPLFVVGIVICFFNIIIGGIISVSAIGLFFYYRNSSKNQSSIYYNQALQYLAKGDIISAKNFLNKAICLNGENYDAYLTLASINYKLREYKEALTNFKSGKLERIGNEHTKYIVAECYFNIENYEKTIENLEGLELKHDYMKFLKSNLLATSYFHLKNYEKALEIFEGIDKKQVQGKSEIMRYNYHKALSYINLNRDEEAKPYLEELISRDRYYKDVEMYGKQLNLIK